MGGKNKMKHDKLIHFAVAIIENAIEPLMYGIAEDIAGHKYMSRRQIIGKLKKGMENEEYYELEDKIINIIEKYIK